jgi:catechol 2,3-dioxygenase-like lactoylglutathione lyase family enzyme
MLRARRHQAAKPGERIAVSPAIGPLPSIPVRLDPVPELPHPATTGDAAGSSPRKWLRRPHRSAHRKETVMDYRLEVVTVPVSDVDRAAEFYSKIGFHLDVDYHPTDNFRVVQMTPPGSHCSIQFGVGLTDAEPGSMRTTYLVVSDVEQARQVLLERGIEAGPVQHKEPVDEWEGGLADGPHPERRDFASFARFSDPDGNGWILQEIGWRAPATATAGAVEGHDTP